VLSTRQPTLRNFWQASAPVDSLADGPRLFDDGAIQLDLRRKIEMHMPFDRPGMLGQLPIELNNRHCEPSVAIHASAGPRLPIRPRSLRDGWLRCARHDGRLDSIGSETALMRNRLLALLKAHGEAEASK